MNKNLCPFNGFKECIGEDCVLFLKDVSASAESDDRTIKIDFNKLFEIPCALAFNGISSVYNITNELAKSSLKNG